MSELTSAISNPMDSCNYKSMSGVQISRVSIQPENRTEVQLTQGNTCDIFFSLPSRPDTFFNGAGSYLSFTYSFDSPLCTLAGAETVSVANGNPASFFSCLETTANSTHIELINDYGVFASLVDDFQSYDRSTKLGSILQDKSTIANKKGFDRTVAAQGIERRVCIPLLSIFGTLADKYIPVGKDCGFRLRLTCADPLIALVSNAAGSLGYRLRDLSWECEYLTVPTNIYNSIQSESGGVFKVSGTGIGSFGANGPAQLTAQTILIPARYSSVRNFMTINRTSANLTAKSENSLGSRCRDNINSYVYRISGQNFPQLPVVCDAYTSAEAMTEVIKCWHGHADLNLAVNFDRDAYVHNTGSGGAQGAFVMGINFEEAGFSSSQMSGKNTTSGNTFLDIGYSQASTATTFTTFAFYDMIMEITGNGEVLVSK